MAPAELRHIVRIANTDMDGKKNILVGLAKIKGVGINFANAVCRVCNIDVQRKLGSLTDAELVIVESTVKDPAARAIPAWLFNRRHDMDTGKDLHAVAANLQFVEENDVKMMKKIKSYKGIRHMQGAPVRGQRTRSNFRRNKGKVMGVKHPGKGSGGTT